MSDPEADFTDSENFLQDLHSKEFMSDKRSKIKKLEKYSDEQFAGKEEKKIALSEEGSSHSLHTKDKTEDKTRLNNDRREREDQPQEVGNPGDGASSKTRQTEASETKICTTNPSTTIPVSQKTDGTPIGVGNSITPTSTLDKTLEEQMHESRNTESDLKLLQPLTEGAPITEKDKTAENDKTREAGIKTPENEKEEIKDPKIAEKEGMDTPEEKKVKKIGLDAGVTTEGKKLGPKISGIGAGAVRSLGTGPFKGSSVPLLLSMPTGGGLSLLSAGLPPGRYVILPSTTSTVPSISSIPSTSSPVGIKTTVLTTPLTHTSKPISVASLSTVTTTTSTITSSPSVIAPPVLSGRVVRPPVIRGTYCPPGGKSIRGRRKSYTAAEKLAMIEAVESGQKKSNVADLFGVAPSTLACILLQKNKIRSDQMKVVSLAF